MRQNAANRDIPASPRQARPRAEVPLAGELLVTHWSLTTLREKLIKIGAKVVTQARYVIFQIAEVAVPRKLFREILRRIRRLREPVPG